MHDVLRILGSQRKSVVIRLLFVANLILLGVAWVMSIYRYSRLPLQVSSWLSLWKSGQPQVERSLAFFIYPICQVFIFLALLALARIFLLRAPNRGRTDRPPDPEKTKGILDLKKEVTYLALIFVNLIFIHLQTSLILLSHQIVSGINTLCGYCITPLKRFVNDSKDNILRIALHQRTVPCQPDALFTTLSILLFGRQLRLTFSSLVRPSDPEIPLPFRGDAVIAVTMARFLRPFSRHGRSLSSSASRTDCPLSGVISFVPTAGRSAS